MRKAVKRPDGQPAIHHVTQTVELHPLTVSGSYVHHEEAAQEERLQRAQVIDRSHLVSRFGSVNSSAGVIKKVEHLHVKAAPEDDLPPIEHPHHVAPLQERGTPLAYGVTTPSEALFDRGIEQASAHEHAHHHKVSRRHRVAHRMGIHPNLINIGAASLLGLLLLGFFVYQNNTKLAMRVASSKAGITASAPTTLPAGFAMAGPIRYAPGTVTLSFNSHNNDKAFDISEQRSDWTSNTLFSNMFADGTIAYQTHQQNGLTIYTYGQGNATWVSGGMRYDITGDAGLNSDQLLRIATSL
jgi:hypothetical protein